MSNTLPLSILGVPVRTYLEQQFPATVGHKPLQDFLNTLEHQLYLFDKSKEQHKKACDKILTELSGLGICTPEETYGADIHWAIRDLLFALREAQEAIQAFPTAPPWLPGEPKDWPVVARNNYYRWLARTRTDTIDKLLDKLKAVLKDV